MNTHHVKIRVDQQPLLYVSRRRQNACILFHSPCIDQQVNSVIKLFPTTSALLIKMQKSATENITKALSICIYSCFS